MEVEKETAEEKEDEKEKINRITAGTCMAYPDLPIMHWEDLSQRIAELEKQEQERMERSKVRHSLMLAVVSVNEMDVLHKALHLLTSTVSF